MKIVVKVEQSSIREKPKVSRTENHMDKSAM